MKGRLSDLEKVVDELKNNVSLPEQYENLESRLSNLEQAVDLKNNLSDPEEHNNLKDRLSVVENSLVGLKNNISILEQQENLQCNYSSSTRKYEKQACRS